jgi:hypothetical protein
MESGARYWYSAYPPHRRAVDRDEPVHVADAVTLAAAVLTRQARRALPARHEHLDRDSIPHHHTPSLRRPRPDRLEHPDGLVTGNERKSAGQLSGVLLVIGSAQAAGHHPDEPVVIADVRNRQLADREPARRLQHQRPRGPAVAHQPAEPAALNSSNSSSLSMISAAATFSSRCATFDVPGIGNITGDRFSNHASASCDGVAW